MSMRPWVGYAVMGHMGMACVTWVAMSMACVLLVAGYGRGRAWGMGRGVGGRSPMAMAGGGGEWGPHTKESIKCIPQSGTHKIQKAFPNLEP